jgi:prophage tail gpP-like protein
MNDTVELIVGTQGFRDWDELRIESNLYQSEGSFTFATARPAEAIVEGSRCQIKVNDKLAITGIIDRIEERYGRDGRFFAISGRDNMGLLIDQYLATSRDYEGYTVDRIANALLSSLPFINAKAVSWENGARNFNTTKRLTHIELGATVHSVLSGIAESRGMIFYCKPDGTLCITKPKSSGTPKFALETHLDGRNNNILSALHVRDLSKRYRKVVVVGQQQAADDIFGTAVNIRGEAEDLTMPENLKHKTLVQTISDDDESPNKLAEQIKQKTICEGWSVEYTTPGYSQRGNNWAVNELCYVNDEVFKIGRALLVAGVSMKLQRTAGATTTVKLGLPGK